jgi:hypothetical protein
VTAAKSSTGYAIGECVRILKSVTTLPPLPSHVGTVKEVVVCYTDKTVGYALSLTDDPRPERVWFFFQHQLRRA